MPVCRVMKKRNFTTVCNVYLQDQSLSIKAKGLLTLMLALPENWDYTIKGLMTLSSDGRDSVSAAIKELESHRYIRRSQARIKNGTFTRNEYWIYETPQENWSEEKALLESEELYGESENEALSDLSECSSEDEEMTLEDPDSEGAEPVFNTPESTVSETEKEAPFTGKPRTENPSAEKPTQLNTNKQNTKRQKDRYDTIRARVREQLEYPTLLADFPQVQIDELVSLIAEVMLCKNEEFLIAGAAYPKDLVKARMEALRAESIRYVLDCLRETKPNIKNIKKYLLAALFNAAATQETYYDTKVMHDVFRNGAFAGKGGNSHEN